MTTGNIYVPQSGLVRGINLPWTGIAGGVEMPSTRLQTGLYYSGPLNRNGPVTIAPSAGRVGNIEVPQVTKIGGMVAPATAPITELYGTGIEVPAQGEVGGVAVPEMTNVGGLMVPASTRIKDFYGSFLQNKVSVPVVGAMSVGTLILASAITFFVLRWLKHERQEEKVIKELGLGAPPKNKPKKGSPTTLVPGPYRTDYRIWKISAPYSFDTVIYIGSESDAKEYAKYFFKDYSYTPKIKEIKVAYSATTPFVGRTEGEGDFFEQYGAPTNEEVMDRCLIESMRLLRSDHRDNEPVVRLAIHLYDEGYGRPKSSRRPLY